MKDKQVWDQRSLGPGPALNLISSAMSSVENACVVFAPVGVTFLGPFCHSGPQVGYCEPQATFKAVTNKQVELRMINEAPLLSESRSLAQAISEKPTVMMVL